MGSYDRDHYKVLGLGKSASKEEIKMAFRKLAMEFHPDKHAQSSKAIRDAAAIRFKQVSEAYEVLIDDAKRADYNFRSRAANASASDHSANYSSYYYSNYDPNAYRRRQKAASVWISKIQDGFHFLNSRSFLHNAIFASAILGAVYTIDKCSEASWNMLNSGKSFEDAMESVQKAREPKDKK